MDKMESMNLSEIRQAGLKALNRELGAVKMIRFLQQFDLGEGDYSIQRHQWFKNQSLEKLIEKLLVQRQTKDK
ncbi:hypothetical protein THII_2142 [Thioploca ingrica]|uniref:Uncharacterized protein n=1 Tax=Thioploca ingrica TaxID=40754 RepID=A0A090AGW6_9GAMM|nr:hypothetical protein THII_2142 [Thioploca ingrica]